MTDVELTNAQLEAEVAQHVMGLEVVGECGTCGQEDGCEMVSAAPCWADRTRPVYVRECACAELLEVYDEDEDEDALWPNREDEQALKKRVGHIAFCLEAVPHYATDMDQAMLVRDRIREAPFSTRQRFLSKLGNLLLNRGRHRLAWTELILELTPRAVCLAAVHAARIREEIRHGD